RTHAVYFLGLGLVFFLEGRELALLFLQVCAGLYQFAFEPAPPLFELPNHVRSLVCAAHTLKPTKYRVLSLLLVRVDEPPNLIAGKVHEPPWSLPRWRVLDVVVVGVGVEPGLP